jgi:peroxiredoxin
VIARYHIRDESYRGQKEYGIPHPAVFVLDQQGRVRWSKVEHDYTERPPNEEVAAALDAIE